MNTRPYLFSCILLSGLPLHAMPGDLDTTFNGTGKVTIPFGSGSDGGNSIAVQSDGKILVAGYSDNGSNRNFALMRLTSTGVLDTSFSGDGKAIADFGSASNDTGTCVAVQSDGKILVGGFTSNGSDTDFALARFNSDGTLDTSFSGDGKATADFGSGSSDTAYSVALQSDGKILIAGKAYDISDTDFALARFTSAGALDTSFNSDGKVNIGFGYHEAGNCVAVQSDGKILVAGYSQVGTNRDFALVRYTSAGALDTSFGGDGQITTSLAGNEGISSMVLQSNGKIVVVGSSGVGMLSDVAVVRYTSTGALDTSFSNDGKVLADLGTPYDYGNSLAVQSDGMILVAGATYDGNRTQLALVRFNSSGTVDTSFSGDGVVTTGFGSTNTGWGHCVAVQADGKILVAGNGSNNDIAVVRYLDKPYPPEVGLWNISGLTNTSVTLNGTVNPNGLATAAQFEYGITPNYGSIALAALSPNNGTTTQAVSATITGLTPGTVFYFRLTATNGDGIRSTSYLYFTTTGSSNLPGTLDLNLDADGIQTTAVGPADDFGSSVAVQSNGRIVVAGSSFNGTDNDFAVVRYTSNGALDSSFGTGGKVITSIGSGDDGASSLVVQSDGRIVVAGCHFNGSNYDIAVVRYMPNGALDGTFGSGGKVITQVNNYDDLANAVALQTNGKIVVAGSSWNGSNNDVALVRYTTSGALDTSFGAGGKVITPIGSSDDSASSLAIQSDGKIVVAGTSWGVSNHDFAVVRYIASGALDGSFGTGGKVTTAIGSSHDYGSSVVIQGDGKIVVAGSSSNGSDSAFALVRYTTSGALDNGFGTGGKAANFYGQNNGASVALQRDGKILLAGSSYGGFSSVALLRYTPYGLLDDTFGTQGVVSTRIHQTGWASSMAIQSDGKIVVAGSSFYEFDYDFALARYNSDPIPPNVQTRSVTAISTTTATLTGTGNPNGSAAMAWFEYGTTTSYGSSTPPQSIGSDTSDQDVSAEVNNLVPGTLYHYRLVVYNGMVTAYGENMSFTATTMQQGWRQLYFGTTSNSGNAADNFDSDRDGLSNLIEWACNLIPTTSSVLPASLSHNGANLEFTYTRSVAAVNAGAVFTVEWSDALPGTEPWSTADVTEQILSDNGSVQQVKATLPADSSNQRFVRLRVVSPP